MLHKGSYKCTDCGSQPGREQLTAVVVQFKPIGAGAKVLKSRTTHWLCPECLKKNPVWNLSKHDAPAYQL